VRNPPAKGFPCGLRHVAITGVHRCAQEGHSHEIGRGIAVIEGEAAIGNRHDHIMADDETRRS
jgi:hypothetical protein